MTQLNSKATYCRVAIIAFFRAIESVLLAILLLPNLFSLSYFDVFEHTCFCTFCALSCIRPSVHVEQGNHGGN